MHFQSQNWRFRVFEAGFLKDFQNQLVISNGQAKTSSLIFSSTEKQKIVKTISISTFLFLQAFKKYSSRDTFPLNLHFWRASKIKNINDMFSFTYCSIYYMFSFQCQV
jgi:hypothetical protein